MPKLATADHVDAIIRILSADDWLVDHMWSIDRHAKVLEWRAVDGTVRKPGAATAGTDRLVATDEPSWADRAAWDADPISGRHRPPFVRGSFKRQSKRKVDGEIRRVFSTHDGGLDAHTFELGDAIVRVEFHQTRVPYVDRVQDLVRTVQGTDIPAAPPPEAPGYDVIGVDALRTMVMDAAVARMMEDDDYETPEEVHADYDPLTLDTAIHNGWPYTRKVEDDLSRIDFSTENTDLDRDPKDMIGFNSIGDLTFLGVFCGGDWETPLCFILYAHQGKLRGYVPEGGNVYNRRTMKAWGNGKRDEEALMAAADARGELDLNGAKLRADIAAHFGIAT